MTFKQATHYSLTFTVLLGMVGCIGSDSNSREAGLVVHLAETHFENSPTATAALRMGEAATAQPTINSSSKSIVASDQASAAEAATPGGYDHENLEHHEIRDQNSRLLSLYRTYLALDNIKLVPCTDLTQLPRKLFEGLIGTATAHSGHGSEPVAGRALDKPNVIDIVTRDGYILPLGDIATAPGRYCGLQVALVRLAGEGYGKPEFEASSTDDPITDPGFPELTGSIFAINADYCTTTDATDHCLTRAKVDLRDNGLTEPAIQTISLAQPLEINATLREGYIALGITYGEWLHNVDVTRLTGDSGEQQKLLDNIARSFFIYATGLGELPTNITE